MVCVNMESGVGRMITTDDQKTAEELLLRLLAQGKEHIRRIILYGSRARGTASPDSDFDLLVVEDDPVSKWDEMWRLRHAMRDVPYPVDVWVMGKREFEETKNVIGGLAYPAHKYGVVLYENP
jgi:predicted nucleotidyltransferase